MKLTGKLKSEFEEWFNEDDNDVDLSEDGNVWLSRCYKELPLSMQFVLLCDFLEGKVIGSLIIYDTEEKEFIVGFKRSNMEEWVETFKTKQEAIEKAIKCLNKNY